MKFWPQLPDRAEEPRRQGRVLQGLRGAQLLAGQHREGAKPSEGPNLSHSPVAQQFRLRVQEGYVSKKKWPEIAANLKPVYADPAVEATEAALKEIAEEWGKAYPATIRLWCSAWTESVSSLDHGIEVPKVLCSTNVIESLNARFRRAVRTHGHFPNEQAALKTL